MLRIDSTHQMEDYLQLLRTSSVIYVDNERLDKAVAESGYLADDMNALTLLELRIESAGSYQYVTPDNIIDFLIRLGVDLDKRMRNRKTQRYSLDMKKVVEPLIEQGVAVNLLSAYKTYRSYKTYSSFLKTMADQKQPHKKTSDGRLILKYDTVIKEKENLRVYYREIAAVSIPKIFSSIVTGPSEEYHLAWCDYPQADWRFAYNLFIKDESNFSVMQSYDDSYEGLARLVEGDKFDPSQFKETRREYKVDCLSVFYNSRNNKAIPTAMRNYFRSRKKYARYVYDLGVLYYFKLPVPCTSYFGYTQQLPEASYPDAFISKGLNTPIQTFTSHIVIETVFGVLERFWSLGYTKDDINVYYVRHDEPIFYFRDTILKDAWVFADCSEIRIDGFTPIKLGFQFGNYYKEEDPSLTETINRNIALHPEKIHTYDDGPVHDYNPVPSVESVYIQLFQDGDILDVVYYDYWTRKRFGFLLRPCSTTDAFYSTINEAIELLSTPEYLLVKNEDLDVMDRLGPDESTLVKSVSKFDSGVAIQLNDWKREKLAGAKVINLIPN